MCMDHMSMHTPLLSGCHNSTNPSDGQYINMYTNIGKHTQTHGVRQDIITLHIFSTENLGRWWKSVTTAPQLHLPNSSLRTQHLTRALKWVPADFPGIKSLLHNISLKGHVMSSRKQISVHHLHGNKSFISLEIRYVKYQLVEYTFCSALDLAVKSHSCKKSPPVLAGCLKDTFPESKSLSHREGDQNSTQDSQWWLTVEHTSLWCLQGICLKNPDTSLSSPLRRHRAGGALDNFRNSPEKVLRTSVGFQSLACSLLGLPVAFPLLLKRQSRLRPLPPCPWDHFFPTRQPELLTL